MSEFSPSNFLGDNPDPWVLSLRSNAAQLGAVDVLSLNDNPGQMISFLLFISSNTTGNLRC